MASWLLLRRDFGEDAATTGPISPHSHGTCTSRSVPARPLGCACLGSREERGPGPWWPSGAQGPPPGPHSHFSPAAPAAPRPLPPCAPRAARRPAARPPPSSPRPREPVTQGSPRADWPPGAGRLGASGGGYWFRRLRGASPAIPLGGAPGPALAQRSGGIFLPLAAWQTHCFFSPLASSSLSVNVPFPLDLLTSFSLHWEEKETRRWGFPRHGAVACGWHAPRVGLCLSRSGLRC